MTQNINMTTLRYLQPRCFDRAQYGTPTPVVLSATGHSNPVIIMRQQPHMKDLKVWADELGLDWQNDLDVSQRYT